jgi:hypothetical protein
MKRAILVLFAASIAIAAKAGPAWDAMQNGLKAYADGDFAKAATNFDSAAIAAQQEKFDPAVAAFDQANALMKSGKMTDAAHGYESALRTTDLGLQSKAYHNRGNAMIGIAGEQEKQEKFEDAIKSVDEAMTMYERSMMLAAQDRDPKINYELAGLKRKDLEEKLKKQQQQQQQNKDQKKDQNKDQKDQNKDQKKDQNDDQKKDDQDKQKQDQQKKDQQKKDENKQDQDQQKKDQQKQDESQDKKNNEQMRTEKMTPQEAAMMLDAMKQREQAQREKMGQIWLKRSNAGKLEPVDKDW